MDYINQVHTRPIDSTGEIITMGPVSGGIARAKVLTLHLDADAAASYAVDVGGRTAENEIRWFDSHTYDSTDMDTTTIDDAWEQSEQYLRIRVTGAAADGSEADIYVAAGR